MKKNIKTLFTIALLVGFAACKQNNIKPQSNNGSINITNAVVGGSTVNLTTGNSPYITSGNNSISNYGYAFLPLLAGNIDINIGIPAQAATNSSPAIPAVTYYKGNLDVDKNSNYSLFLTGVSDQAIDNVLIKETYQRTYADSICGVRFINLSPGSDAVSVDIAGSANGSEVGNLEYKAYTGFNKHPATVAINSYTFEFRDAATGNLLTSYSLNAPYFHNATLCLSGTAGNYTVIEDDDF